MRAELEAERIVLLAEPIQASVSGERLRAAGLPKGRALAAFALTQQRIVLHVMGVALVDATWDSGDPRQLDVAVVEDALQIGVDVARSAEGRTAHAVVRLRLPDPAAVLAAIEQRRRPLDPRRHVRD